MMNKTKAAICMVIFYGLLFCLYVFAVLNGEPLRTWVMSTLSGFAMLFFARGFYRWLIKKPVTIVSGTSGVPNGEFRVGKEKEAAERE